MYDRVTWVARVKDEKSPYFGLPTILGTNVFKLCYEVKIGINSGSLSRIILIKFKLLLTLLSFFRAASPEFADIKVQTITGAFSGISEEINPTEIREALKDLGLLTLKVKKPRLLQFTTKSGPSSPLAVLGIGFDLIGWMCNPSK